MAAAEQMTTRLGLRERKKLQTRKDLLDVARQLFSENEFADVTVEQITELAGVSQKTFFNYFQNKAQFLSAYLTDWMLSIGFWSFEDSPIAGCRSALFPTDAFAQREWIIDHRRIFKMAMHHTDFFDFIYKLDEDSADFDAELHDAVRKQRVARIRQAQEQGIVRDDISAIEVCRLYDALRIDAVRRWLYLENEDARPELLHERFDKHLDVLVRGIEARD